MIMLPQQPSSWYRFDPYFGSVTRPRKRRREASSCNDDVPPPPPSLTPTDCYSGSHPYVRDRFRRRSKSCSLIFVAFLFIQHCCTQSPITTHAFSIVGGTSIRTRNSATHLWATNPSDEQQPAKKQRQKGPKASKNDQKLMASKRKAISALSQPATTTTTPPVMGKNPKETTKQQRNGSVAKRKNNGAVEATKRKRTPQKTTKRRPRNLGNDLQQRRTTQPKLSQRKQSKASKQSASSPPTSFTSLLPPTNRVAKQLQQPPPSLNPNDESPVGVGTSNGTVPFWEQFLEKPSPKKPKERNNNKNGNEKNLPSIEDLFPAAPTSTTGGKSTTAAPASTLPSIAGVLPVAELFYRSTPTDTSAKNNNNSTTGSAVDDEELPFSKTQSNAVVTPKRQPRRIVRRGMEMLVGGVPINADPPMRSLQLGYNESSGCDWASVIGTNTNEFGPLLHAKHAPKVTDWERGLYCEYFRYYTHKWNVCPEDLQAIGEDALSSSSSSSSVNNNSGANAAGTQYELTERKDVFDIEGEFSMDMAIPRHEFLACEGEEFPIFRDVLTEAFRNVLAEAARDDESDGFDIQIPTLSVVESSVTYGYSHLRAVVKVAAGFDARGTKLYRRVKRISAAFVKAMDDDDIAVSIAEAARNETRWPEELRHRLAEDCLFGDVEDREDAEDEDVLLIPEPQSLITDLNAPASSLFEEQQAFGKADLRRQRELFRGSGKDGAYPDYSAPNARNAPYQGQIGLRLVDAVIERAKMRQPRVIAVGDVHGCIDELQELLRLCDYRPGDLVLFLGDLVCKGPDSLSVVQMAREIGAIGVRGNHDFEVVRWHQAILAGIDRPVFGSEHFYIATCLSKADLKWLYSLPWFVSSKSLDSLFVHAGFVAGIRLSKQNPRLMLNMRSILPDGTVTSKYFTNWPWARLWDGPSTVYFGHDADRGLQQWPNAVGLDTGCVYGGRLTAMLLPERRLVSTPAKREYFKYRRKHFH